MAPVTRGVMETNNATSTIKQDVKKGLEKLASLSDEVKLKLHLASLDAKKEWDERLYPRVVEVEGAVKSITDNINESTHSTLGEVVSKVETFLLTLRQHDGQNNGKNH